MLKKHESRQELEDEALFAKKIGKRFRCNLIKAPITYHFDFFAFREKKLVSVIELKTSKKYSISGLRHGFSICALKLIRCLELAEAFKVPFFVYLEEPTGLYYIKITKRLLDGLKVEFITTNVLNYLAHDGSGEPFDVVYKFKQELWEKVEQWEN